MTASLYIIMYENVLPIVLEHCLNSFKVNYGISYCPKIDCNYLYSAVVDFVDWYMFDLVSVHSSLLIYHYSLITNYLPHFTSTVLNRSVSAVAFVHMYT